MGGSFSGFTLRGRQPPSPTVTIKQTLCLCQVFCQRIWGKPEKNSNFPKIRIESQLRNHSGWPNDDPSNNVPRSGAQPNRRRGFFSCWFSGAAPAAALPDGSAWLTGAKRMVIVTSETPGGQQIVTCCAAGVPAALLALVGWDGFWFVIVCLLIERCNTDSFGGTPFRSRIR